MIHIIIGTRAQLIKVAPVIIELKNRSIDYSFVFTGQHNVTIDDLIGVFGIKHPDLRLYNGKEIIKISQVPFWSFKCVLKSISGKDFFNKGNVTLVHGDAYSAILGVIIAKLSRMNVGHIEAGLRSFDFFNPFPEEIVRVLTSKLTVFHFCPGRWAINNLKKNKGIKIDTKLNTLYDALRLFVDRQVAVDPSKKRYGIVSIHRFENIYSKERLKLIADLISDISKKISLLFVLHPSTKHNLKRYGLLETLKQNENIELRPRYTYFKFVKLMMNSEFVITDGGSNQEECYYLGKPCLLFRDKTERLEGLGKNVVLSKFDRDIIHSFIDNYERYQYPLIRVDRTPSKIIVDFLEDALS